MTIDHPVLSVIIVNWNVKAYLTDCLRSIPPSLGGSHVERIVVDNASTDASMEAVEQELPDVITIQNDKNLGFAVANNQGARRARGRYLLFLNPDTLVIDDALEVMLATMESHPEVGVLGPRLEDERGRPRLDMGHRLPSARTMANHFLFLSRVSHSLFPGVVRSAPPKGFEYCDWLCGACFMVRRQVFERVQWNEDIFIHAEDMDYCERASRAGWRMAVTGDACVIHYAGRSFAQQMRRDLFAGTPSAVAVYLRRRHGLLTAAMGIAIMRLSFRMRWLAHEAIYRATGDPERRYKANKLQTFMAFDDFSVIRRANRKAGPTGQSPAA
jgi:GT2 family glycosyltransferase